jgi:TetR/AcrR family transcriptional regulator, cholesterol catabolism regulator
VTGAQAERRHRILDATIALASEGGYDAVQMRTVAEQAGVALGTLYRYFPSKIHLLVAALARELGRVDHELASDPASGGTPADRVVEVLSTTSRELRGDQHLTEALTRAFMFADRSVREEVTAVTTLVTTMLTRAMNPAMNPAQQPAQQPASEEDLAMARVIGDVWLCALVAWATGRSSAQEAAGHVERAVRMLLRQG